MKYKSYKKLVFWNIIKKFFKEKGGYNFIELKNSVIGQMNICIDKLIEKKIGSGTQIDQNDFKIIVKQFAI